ncbi:MAG: type III secretion system stator protein SctL [Acidobacteriota bacterium]|nr:type III secretion system stator protein SctL [Acidobacteriota bacterium]
MSVNKVIKKTPFQEQTSIGGGVVKRPVVDAKAEARNIVADAEAYAAATRASAESSAREAREAAYAEGYEAALAELNKHVLDARERRDNALAGVERDVLRLAVKIAEKIIGREIERDAATVADIVATALRYARLNEMLTIRINPADFPAVETHRGRLDPTGRARFLDVVPDPRVARGGCVIESESGAVDAQLETQLRVLERALLTRAPPEQR